MRADRAPAPSGQDGGRGRRRPSHAAIALVLSTLIAVVLPVSALLLASRSALQEVEHRTLAGSQATAGALAGQVHQAYDDTMRVLERAGDRLAVVAALAGGDVSLAQRSLVTLLETTPVNGVAFYDTGGALLLEAHVPAARTPPLPPSLPSTGVLEEPVEAHDRGVTRRVSGPMTDKLGIRRGTYVADVDVSRLVTDPGALRFGRTGVSYLVGTDTRILLGGDPASVGLNLMAPDSQRVTRDHQPATLVTFSPYYQQEVVQAYVPVPGAPWGVLTLQFTSEAFAGANRLADRLDLLAAVFGAFGACMTIAVWVVVGRRERRIAVQNLDLARSEQRFRMLFDDAPAGVALVALDGRCLRVNPALCEMLGVPEDRLLGSSLDDLTRADGHEPGGRPLADLAVGEADGARLETRYVRPDGRTIWISVHVSAVRDTVGEPGHLVTHVVEVSDRHEATAALAEMESRYRTLVASLHEGIMVRALDGTLLVVNESAARILGVTMDELLRREAADPRWPFVDLDGTVGEGGGSATARALGSGEPVEGVLAGVDHPDGSLHLLSLNVHPLRRDGEDGSYAVLVSFTDVTDQREAEAALEHRALYDALTGAANRNLVSDRIEHAMARAGRRFGSSVALVFVDLDKFKPVNDRYGHASGDRVLQVVARRLVESVRTEDTVGRLGGDEFCVVLEGVSEDDASQLAAKLEAAIEQPISLTLDGGPTEVRVGASVGVALARGSTTPEDLINEADAAMYEAKRRRREAVASSPL